MMENSQHEMKRAKTIRTEYNRDIEAVQTWIQSTEAKVENKNVEPQILQEFLQEIHCEVGTVTDQLDRACRNGSIIIERTNNEQEKELISKTITSITEQMQHVKNWLDDKKSQVGDSLESWQTFIQLYNTLRGWLEKQKTFLSEPLMFSTLNESKTKLHEYACIVKECKWANKQVSEMNAELTKIGQVSNVGPLAEKQVEIEQEKSDCESKLKEVMSLLQEMAEEWEQCERKSKDVAAWIEKTRQSLDNPQNKKRSLRDQLTVREKSSADVTIQKAKLTMAMEKLKVHFRDRMCANAQVSHENEMLQSRLEELQGVLRDDCTTLEACVHQMDIYQQEIYKLRQDVVGVEQQLRLASAPNYSPRDRDKALAEQSAAEYDHLSPETTVIKKPAELSTEDSTIDVERQVESLEKRIRSLVDCGLGEQMSALQKIIKEIDVLEGSLNVVEQKGERMQRDSEMRNMLSAVSGMKIKLKAMKASALTKEKQIRTQTTDEERQQLDLVQYQHLLQDLECWAIGTYTRINAQITSFTSLSVAHETFIANQKLLQDLTLREEHLKDLKLKCNQVKGDDHLLSLARDMTEHLNFLSKTMNDARTVLQNRLGQLKVRICQHRPYCPYFSSNYSSTSL